MNSPWYWYPYRCHGRVHVTITSAPRGSVKGRYWVIPWRIDHETKWNIYLEPKELTVEGMNGEWVFSHKERPPHWDCDKSCERCYPPPIDYCECYHVECPNCGKRLP